MSRHARRRRDGDQPISAALPTIEQCLYHRCADHENIPQLDNSVDGAECAACIYEMFVATRAQLLLALDGYAERLAYSHQLARTLDSAMARLNLMSPGAGDALDDEPFGTQQQ